eukprot:Lankesteria_metandrocarpae@DN4693_c0_g1_i5.p1
MVMVSFYFVLLVLFDKVALSSESEKRHLIPDDVIVDESKFLLMHQRGPCWADVTSQKENVQNPRSRLLLEQGESIESLAAKAFLISKFGLDLVEKVGMTDFRKNIAGDSSNSLHASSDNRRSSNVVSQKVVHEVGELEVSMALRRSMTLDSLSVLLALHEQSTSPVDRRSKAVNFVSKIASLTTRNRRLVTPDDTDNDNHLTQRQNESVHGQEELATTSTTMASELSANNSAILGTANAITHDNERKRVVDLLEQIVESSQNNPPVRAEVFPEESITLSENSTDEGNDFSVSSSISNGNNTVLTTTSELESLIEETRIRSSKLLKRLYVDVLDFKVKTPLQSTLRRTKQLPEHERLLTPSSLQEIAECLPCIENNFTPELLLPIDELLPPSDLINKYSSAAVKYANAAYANNATSTSFNPIELGSKWAKQMQYGMHHNSNATVAAMRPGLNDSVIVSVEPNDEFFYAQWSVFATDLQAGWNTFSGSTNPFPVAVVDTGCAYHPDLAANLWVDPDIPACQGSQPDYPNFHPGCYGYDFGDGDGIPCDEPLDVVHGTAVSGVVGASSNNGVGVTGVCWRCQIVCLKIVQNNVIPLSTVLESYDYILAKNIKISNHSYAGWGFIPIQYSAMEAMRDAGHLFVAAAGNNGCNVDDTTDTRCGGSHPIRPAGYNLDNILSVGSSDINNKISRFSNYGGASVDVFAPGDEVFLLWNSMVDTPLRGFNIASGTSFACPFVAGVAALVWGANPSWDYKKVIQRIKNTVQTTSEMEGRSTSGGVVNVGAALQFTEISEDPLERSSSTLVDLTGLFYNVTSDGYSCVTSWMFMQGVLIAQLVQYVVQY